MTAPGLRLDTVTRAAEAEVVVIVRGEVDAHTSSQLTAVLDSVVDEGMLHIELDVSELTFMDSSGVGALIAVLDRVGGAGGSVSMTRPNPQVRQVLELTDLASRIDLRDD